MNQKINIISLQINPKIGKKEENFFKIKKLLDTTDCNKPDLIILPEFFNTGICIPEFQKSAETEQYSETISFFKEIAKEKNSYILCGSIIEKENDNLYNTSWLLDRQGNTVAKYRKMHLFDCNGGTENQYLKSGNEVVVFEADFGKIGFSTCFDIKFPLHFLELIKKGAEIIVEPAGWSAPNQVLEKATQEWILLNQTRAIDNIAYFVSSNLCGQVDSTLTSCGNSMIVSPTGEILANAQDKECCISATIDMKILRLMRKQFGINRLIEGL